MEVCLGWYGSTYILSGNAHQCTSTQQWHWLQILPSLVPQRCKSCLSRMLQVIEVKYFRLSFIYRETMFHVRRNCFLERFCAPNSIMTFITSTMSLLNFTEVCASFKNELKKCKCLIIYINPKRISFGTLKHKTSENYLNTLLRNHERELKRKFTRDSC